MTDVTRAEDEEAVIVIPDSQPQVLEVVMVEDDEQPEVPAVTSASASRQGKGNEHISHDRVEHRHRGHGKEMAMKSKVVRPVSRSSKERKRTPKRRKGSATKGRVVYKLLFLSFALCLPICQQVTDDSFLKLSF